MRSRCSLAVPVAGVVLVVLVAASATAGDGRIEEWELPQIAEPSGVIYHPGRSTLFVVGDQGDIAEVAITGELLRSRKLGGDLEGVTCDPTSGLLYVATRSTSKRVATASKGSPIVRRVALAAGSSSTRTIRRFCSSSPCR